jgi:hypothetical protein
VKASDVNRIAMANRKFPKTVYVKFEDGGDGPDYLNIGESLIDMIRTGEKAKIAVYELKEVGDAEGVVNAPKLSVVK